MKLRTNPVTDVWKQRRLFITNEIFVPNSSMKFKKKKNAGTKGAKRMAFEYRGARLPATARSKQRYLNNVIGCAAATY